MSITQKIKRAFQAYLARLEKANQASFGQKPLDCCTLNRPKTTTKAG